MKTRYMGLDLGTKTLGIAIEQIQLLRLIKLLDLKVKSMKLLFKNLRK